MQGQELDSLISVGAFQLRTFCGSVNHFQVTAGTKCTRPGVLRPDAALSFFPDDPRRALPHCYAKAPFSRPGSAAAPREGQGQRGSHPQPRRALRDRRERCHLTGGSGRATPHVRTAMP